MLPTEDGQKNTSNTTAKSSPRFNRDAANDPYYRAAINAAKTRTYRAAVSARLSSSEREDLYQEILLDLLNVKLNLIQKRVVLGHLLVLYPNIAPPNFSKPEKLTSSV